MHAKSPFLRNLTAKLTIHYTSSPTLNLYYHYTKSLAYNNAIKHLIVD